MGLGQDQDAPAVDQVELNAEGDEIQLSSLAFLRNQQDRIIVQSSPDKEEQYLGLGNDTVALAADIILQLENRDGLVGLVPLEVFHVSHSHYNSTNKPYT